MADDDEAKRRLEQMRRDTLERLKAGLGRVNRLEEPATGGLGEIEKRIADEYARHNAVRPDLGE